MLKAWYPGNAEADIEGVIVGQMQHRDAAGHRQKRRTQVQRTSLQLAEDTSL